MWTNNRYSSFSLRPIDINVVDVNDLDASFLMVNNSGPNGEPQLTQNRYLLESFTTQFIGRPFVRLQLQQPAQEPRGQRHEHPLQR